VQKISHRIIGFGFALALLLSQAGVAQALYSPVLSKEVALVKQDILKSRQQNGVGTWLDAWDKLTQTNPAYKNATPSASGALSLYMDAVKRIAIDSLAQSFLDGFGLLMGYSVSSNQTVTSCLRDDIWELEALQEEVLNELFKAALLDDLQNGNALWSDYLKLKARIDGDKGNKIEGLKTDSADTAFWFPNGVSGGVNYYTDCPDSEFTQAIKQAKTSLNRVVDTFSGGGGQLGSFSEMWAKAKLRAIADAAKYLAANQIKLSFGGEVGADTQGLINGNGWARGLKASYNQAVDSFDNLHLGELITTIGKDIGLSAVGSEQALSKALGGNPTISDVVRLSQQAYDDRQLALGQISTKLTFALKLSHVSDNSLIDIEQKMVDINSKIIEGTGKGGIIDACEKLNVILQKECPNKNHAPVDCRL
jgi:hypothetical protein